MSETIPVRILMPDGRTEPATISVQRPPSGQRAPWTLVVSGAFAGPAPRDYPGPDQLEAMNALRRDLEAAGCRLLCQGARTDVYPSGMARDMSAGRKAYVLQMGEPATQVVDIFDPARPDQVGTVDAQTAYRDRWWEAGRAARARAAAAQAAPGEGNP